MKKILSFILLFSVGIFLCIPVLFSVFSHHMDMTGSLCIEHCLDAGTFTNTDIVTSSTLLLPDFVVLRIVFQRITAEIFLVSSLVYLFLIFAPPNKKRKLKNYDYSSLVGIIKLTT